MGRVADLSVYYLLLRYLLHPAGGIRQRPAVSVNATTLASGDEFRMNPWRTSENTSSTSFGEQAVLSPLGS